MKIKVFEYSESKKNGGSTLSLVYINDDFVCYGLEDEERTTKVFGETRIPRGTYKVGLRKEGGHHQRYSSKFSDIHVGMLHVLDVPNFKWILIHVGNTDDDTAGCLLLGDTVTNNTVERGFVGKSTNAYKRFYQRVSRAILSGEEVTITYL